MVRESDEKDHLAEKCETAAKEFLDQPPETQRRQLRQILFKNSVQVNIQCDPKTSSTIMGSFMFLSLCLGLPAKDVDQIISDSIKFLYSRSPDEIDYYIRTYIMPEKPKDPEEGDSNDADSDPQG